MPLKQFSRRELLARPSRAILTFLSIAIGVGAVVAVLLSISTTHEAQRDMLRTMAGKADLEVLADDSKGFDLSILKTIRETAGVKTAVPSLKRFAKLIRGETHATAQVLGIDPKVDQLIRDYQVTSGRMISKRGDAMLDSSFAESLKLKVGDKFRLLAHRVSVQVPPTRNQMAEETIWRRCRRRRNHIAYVCFDDSDGACCAVKTRQGTAL